MAQNLRDESNGEFAGGGKIANTRTSGSIWFVG